MQKRSGRLLALFVPVVLALAACGQGASGPSASGLVATAAVAPTASIEPAPSAGSSTSQSDTAWGRIWDALPAGFPTFPGATVADDASADPVSGRFVVEGDPQQIASWYQAALETATFSTEALSGPLEDGRFVLESVGDGECRIEVQVVPTEGMSFVSVRYGATCPA